MKVHQPNIKVSILPIVNPWIVVEEVAKIKKPNTVDKIYLGITDYVVLCDISNPIKYKRIENIQTKVTHINRIRVTLSTKEENIQSNRN